MFYKGCVIIAFYHLCYCFKSRSQHTIATVKLHTTEVCSAKKKQKKPSTGNAVRDVYNVKRSNMHIHTRAHEKDMHIIVTSQKQQNKLLWHSLWPLLENIWFNQWPLWACELFYRTPPKVVANYNVMLVIVYSTSALWCYKAGVGALYSHRKECTPAVVYVVLVQVTTGALLHTLKSLQVIFTLCFSSRKKTITGSFEGGILMLPVHAHV